MVQVGSFILENPGTVLGFGVTGLCAFLWWSARKVSDGFDVG